MASEMLGEAGTIEVDLACARCGYNLRGLQVSGKCPECAAEVSLSFSGEYLTHADPTWVMQLRQGATLAIGGAAAALAALILPLATYSLRELGYSLSYSELSELAVFVAALAGWMLAAPDPNEVPGRTVAVLRWWLRVVAVAEVVFCLGRVYSGDGLSVLPVLRDIAKSVSAIAFAALLYHRVWVLATVCGEQLVVTHARVLLAVGIVVAVVTHMMWWTEWLAVSFRRGSIEVPIFVLTAGVEGYAIYVFVRLRRLLAAKLREAKKNWNVAGAGAGRLAGEEIGDG